MLSDDECWDLFDLAMDRAVLSREQIKDLSLTDVFVRGRTWEDLREVYLVVEASKTIDQDDVQRAARRAALLGRAGVEAIPVVAGEGTARGVSKQAQVARVWLVTDGKVVPPV